MGDIKDRPYCVGLTGGIGSGKTTIAHLFHQLGVPIIDADIIAHQLTQLDGKAYPVIVKQFGAGILRDDQHIDRKKLRQMIFDHPQQKTWLENLLHPMIRQAMKQALSEIKALYCICVIPLLAESQGIDFIDRTLVIDTPTHLQIERVKNRDHISADQIQKIIAAQADASKRLAIADDVLVNDKDHLALEKKVLKLHHFYQELFENRTY